VRPVARAVGLSAITFGVLLFFVPWYIRRLDPILAASLTTITTLAGALLFLGGALLWGVGMYYLIHRGGATPVPAGSRDPPHRMVVAGPYAYIQHPLLLGLVSMAFGEACWLQSISLCVYAALLAVGFHLYVLYVEEPELERSFGDDYRAYRAAVPRWLPFLSPPARREPTENAV
jgi:protein-S-isoprenylcysteine O-methyltransferase Ste14